MYDFEKYEFGIIDNFEEEKELLLNIETFYNPKKYSCVKLQEDFWWSFYKDTKNIITLIVEDDFVEDKGFNDTYLTVIPFTSLDKLKSCIVKRMIKKDEIIKKVDIENASILFDKEFNKLIEKIDEAYKNKKYMIFYAN